MQVRAKRRSKGQGLKRLVSVSANTSCGKNSLGTISRVCMKEMLVVISTAQAEKTKVTGQIFIASLCLPVQTQVMFFLFVVV